VRALLEAGADPDAPERAGYTPLHAAAHLDDPELVRLLLEHGADASAAAPDGTDAAAMAGPRVRELLASR
jgi:ankyrin repeat protein